MFFVALGIHQHSGTAPLFINDNEEANCLRCVIVWNVIKLAITDAMMHGIDAMKTYQNSNSGFFKVP